MTKYRSKWILSSDTKCFQRFVDFVYDANGCCLLAYWMPDLPTKTIKNDCKNQPLNLLNTFSADVIVHSFAILNQPNVN